MQRRPASCRRIRDTSHLLTKNKLAVLYTCVSQQRFLLILVSGFYLRKATLETATFSPAQCGAFDFKTCPLRRRGSALQTALPGENARPLMTHEMALAQACRLAAAK